MKFSFNPNSVEKPEDLNGALSVEETLTEQELATVTGGYDGGYDDWDWDDDDYDYDY